MRYIHTYWGGQIRVSGIGSASVVHLRVCGVLFLRGDGGGQSSGYGMRENIFPTTAVKTRKHRRTNEH